MGLPEESGVLAVDIVIIILPETVGRTVDDDNDDAGKVTLALELSPPPPVALTLVKLSEIVVSLLAGDVATVLVECLRMDGNSVNVISAGSSTRLSSSISLSPEDGTNGPADEDDDDGFVTFPPAPPSPFLALRLEIIIFTVIRTTTRNRTEETLIATYKYTLSEFPVKNQIRMLIMSSYVLEG